MEWLVYGYWNRLSYNLLYCKIYTGRSLAEMVMLWFSFGRTGKSQLYHRRICFNLFSPLPLVLQSDHFLLLLQTDNVQMGSTVMTMVQNILQINRWLGFTNIYDFLFFMSITDFIPVLLKSFAYGLYMTLITIVFQKKYIKYFKKLESYYWTGILSQSLRF